MQFIKKFEEFGMKDVALVGGKNASLGQMITQLGSKGILIPTGFAITTDAYWHFLDENGIRDRMAAMLKTLKDYKDIKKLQAVGKKVRELITSHPMPKDLADEIKTAYKELSKHYKQSDCDVAVRSSASAEDLPTASFAGQQDTYLNISGDKALLEAVKKCMASLFTDRAIAYRVENNFEHMKVGLSVGIQKMVRSDLACSGIAFSLDTESGFRDAIIIDSSYGLGETIVQGIVTPDSFTVYKPTLKKGFDPIIKKSCGHKAVKLVYSKKKGKVVVQVPVPKEEQLRFSLTDKEIVHLAQAVVVIEEYYDSLNKHWSPMDIEWAKDGVDNKLYIVQARPETVHAAKQNQSQIRTYRLVDGNAEAHKKDLICTGQSIGQKIVSGPARVVASINKLGSIKKGEVIVTRMTDPDWMPAMKKAAAIITQQGGRTCHAAIVSRELGIPAVVGAMDAMGLIKNGEMITIDCSRGSLAYIYRGEIPFETNEARLENIPAAPLPVMVNIGDPDSAFVTSMLPVDGVGLARIEFIISGAIKVHPKAITQMEKVTSKKDQDQIKKLAAAYPDPRTFFIDSLAQGIGMIAAAFYPRPVIVRMSDLKTNEYRDLIGGKYFEPNEENPMIGWRGASRYCHPDYADAFALECAAFRKVREDMGFDNVKIMLPFVRSENGALCVLGSLEKNGLKRGKNGLEIIMMVEVPSNVILIDEFSELFDGFSIGSNDLTQLTLAVDRDSAILSEMFDERNEAVKRMMCMAIEGAKRNKKPIGVCGQAPSDYPEMAEFLIEKGVTSLSLNADSVIPFLMRYK